MHSPCHRYEIHSALIYISQKSVKPIWNKHELSVTAVKSSFCDCCKIQFRVGTLGPALKTLPIFNTQEMYFSLGHCVKCYNCNERPYCGICSKGLYLHYAHRSAATWPHLCSPWTSIQIPPPPPKFEWKNTSVSWILCPAFQTHLHPFSVKNHL